MEGPSYPPNWGNLNLAGWANDPLTGRRGPSSAGSSGPVFSLRPTAGRREGPSPHGGSPEFLEKLPGWAKNSLVRRPSEPYLPPPPNEQKAQVAQLVEQLAFNQLVLGSNPSLRTSFSKRFLSTPYAGWSLSRITIVYQTGHSFRREAMLSMVSAGPLKPSAGPVTDHQRRTSLMGRDPDEVPIPLEPEQDSPLMLSRT